MVARLASSLGLAHLALAEDAVQTAALRAMQRWPEDGIPANPSGCLYVVARRVALDGLRAMPSTVELLDDETQEEAQGLPHTAPAEGRFSTELDDDEPALLFAACHPELPQATPVALALRTMASLELADVAAAVLSSEAAVA
jgi:RNA polymerase sigma-70 factor (ECF subfamily)